MTLIGQFLQQSAQPSSDVPATIQAALGLFLLYAAREVPPVAKAAIAWVNVRTEERKKRMEQIDKLFERIETLEGRADKADERADKAERRADDAETKAASALELARNADTKLQEVQGKLDATLEDNKTKDTLIEVLKTERDHWKGEYQRVTTELQQEREEKRVLIDTLKKRDTDKLDPSAVPDTDPAEGSRVILLDARLVPPEEPSAVPKSGDAS